MIIKQVSTEQFAGIQNRSIKLEKGINVVYGENESGKSTLVNLISSLLFHDIKMNRGLTAQREFERRFFPSRKKDSTVVGDFIDGEIVIEGENSDGVNESYTLSKVWGEDAQIKLTTADGQLRDQAKINQILQQILKYGQGVYKDMLMPTQHSGAEILASLLDTSVSVDSKREILENATKAFVESDGISINAIEEEINKKIVEIEGDKWDSIQNMPVRRNDNRRYTRNVGSIMKAYYDVEDAKQVLDRYKSLEAELSESNEKYTKAEDEYVNLTAKEASFNKFASAIALKNDRKVRQKELSEEINKNNQLLKDWPKRVEHLNSALALREQLDKHATVDKYIRLEALKKDVMEAERQLAIFQKPDEEDIAAVKQHTLNISKLENKLSGMNISAVVEMFNGHSIEIRSLKTNELLSIDGKEIQLMEAVEITIDGVMTMQLAPAAVDATAVNAEILQYKQSIARIYDKYYVQDVLGLEKMREDYSKKSQDLNSANTKYALELGDLDFDELQNKYKAIDINTLKDKVELAAKQKEILLNGKSLAEYITECNTLIKRWQEEYSDIESLRLKNEKSMQNQEALSELIQQAEDMPEEFSAIEDVQAYSRQLKNALLAASEKKDELLKQRTISETLYDDYSVSNEYAKEALDRARQNFSSQQQLLSQWKSIKKVFDTQKELLAMNPLEDLAESFLNYLGLISKDQITSDLPNQDRLDIEVYSKGRLMDYEKLSQGSRQTVYLAFRLAALDYLFPDGGAVAIFDDSFTEMDKVRTDEAVKLLQKFSENHQVIFLTCKEDYVHLLGGNAVYI